MVVVAVVVACISDAVIFSFVINRVVVFIEEVVTTWFVGSFEVIAK